MQAERSLSVSRIPFGPKFSSCSWATVLLVCHSLPLSQSSEATFDQSSMPSLAFYSCSQSSTMRHFGDTSPSAHTELSTFAMSHSAGKDLFCSLLKAHVVVLLLFFNLVFEICFRKLKNALECEQCQYTQCCIFLKDLVRYVLISKSSKDHRAQNLYTPIPSVAIIPLEMITACFLVLYKSD